MSTGGEIADACNDNPPVIDTYRVNKLYSTTAAKADMRSCLPAAAGPMCGAWATDSKLSIAIGGTAETTLHIYYTAPTAPNSSVLFPLQGLFAHLVDPSEPYVLVHNGSTIHVTVTVRTGTATFFDDVIPFSLECGDANYTSWFYLHIQPPP